MSEDGVLAGFLNAQGRVLFDGFVYTDSGSYLLDVDALLEERIQKHLRTYLLRNAVQITPEPELNVYQAWGPSAASLWQSYLPNVKLPPGSIVSQPKSRVSSVGCLDPRHPSLGVRFVSSSLTLPTFEQSFEYPLLRVLLGIPEGAQDFVWGSSLPLESNLDYLKGIDFRKGCYLGQELTIRTYHTGVTRKRILPVQMHVSGTLACELDVAQTPLVQPGTEITTIKSNKRVVVGRMGTTIHNIGLALLRLDLVSDDVELDANGYKVTAFVPNWWPSSQ